MIEASGQVRPYPGERRSGDAVLIEETPQGLLLALIDALGHGPVAADAAQLALDTIRARRTERPIQILEACHQRLLRGRGAAISLISLDRRGHGVFAGVGNVSVRIYPDSLRQVALLPCAGVVGHRLRRLREEEFRLPLDSVGVLHSDGINSALDPLSGSAVMSMAEASHALLARFAKPTDDASLILFAHQGDTRFRREPVR